MKEGGRHRGKGRCRRARPREGRHLFPWDRRGWRRLDKKKSNLKVEESGIQGRVCTDLGVSSAFQKWIALLSKPFMPGIMYVPIHVKAASRQHLIKLIILCNIAVERRITEIGR